ncbi:hypothetical protein NX059_004205 [Plenodomus lindquistii]|nr:hypothetical protein NX059_004205 [Plenodomus lindquistii]
MLMRLVLPLPLRLLTSKLFIQTTKSPVYRRAASTMSTATFRLDPTIFNAELYKSVTDLWFHGIDRTGRELDMRIAARWFGAGTPEEKQLFDSKCRNAFGEALESFGPAEFPEATAQPFVEEIQRVFAEGTEAGNNGGEAAWTALSLVLLLDQMPRNIYRTGDALKTVYAHFDKLSYALTSALLSNDSQPHRLDKHSSFRYSAALRCWFYMPLMHSEDIAAHEVLDAELAAFTKELERVPDVEGSKTFLTRQIKAEREHRPILDEFGRYPHRNAALGRESTAEEVKFLREGGATFGVGDGKK